jgi:phage tail sheath protein FI
MKLFLRTLAGFLVLACLGSVLAIGAGVSEQSVAGALDETTTTTSSKATTTTAAPTTTTKPTTTTTIRSERTSTLGSIATPGVSISEIPAFGESMVQVATGVAAIIGVGPNPSEAPVLVTSLGQFQELFPDTSQSLEASVQQFFTNGGSQALIKGASGSNSSALLSAIGESLPVGADLLIVADLYALPQSEWSSVAVAMGRAASASLAIALVDPPQSVVAQVALPTGSLSALTSLGTELRAASGAAARSILLFASNVVNESGSTLPVSPYFAGLIAATDVNDGFWNAPNGFGNTFSAVRPQFASTRPQDGLLLESGMSPLMYIPGRGTAVLSDRLLSGPSDYLSVERTLNTIQATINVGMQSFVFAANDATTWATVTQAISGYLTGLFTQGALQGSAASDAFSVACGLGSTMTSDDVLNGFMVISVAVAIEHPGEFDRMTFTQTMGTSD